MIINEETKGWATKKLERFIEWRGFPQNPDDLEARVRAFLRLVHNKPLRELVVAASPDYLETLKRYGDPLPMVDWAKKNMDPDQTDVDWILDLIAETGDYFPLPVQMREMYSSKLTPASVFGEAPIKEE